MIAMLRDDICSKLSGAWEKAGIQDTGVGPHETMTGEHAGHRILKGRIETKEEQA